MNINRVTSIEIRNTSSGPYSLDEIIKETLKIYRTGKIVHLQFNRLSDEPIGEYEYKVNFFTINHFFDTLVNQIKVQEWEEDYSVLVCDGWGWELKVRYSNNVIKKSFGTVEIPPSGYELKKLILKLVNYKIEPWVL